MAGGRPPKIKKEDQPELVRKFEEYIENTDIPIVAEFAYQQGLWKSYFHEREEFANLIKKCLTKKEAALEKGTLYHQLNPTMAVFSLKQLGWRDKEAKVVFVDPKTLSDKELKELIDNGG